MKKKATLFILLFLQSFLIWSQNNPTLQTVIPPSPTSREYEKYVDYQVSLQNGIPEISIPLYELRVGNTSIPISLSYHASGIKFGQTDGEVGVGWVLQPGYRISRTINGRPDEYYSMPSIQDPNAKFSDNQLRDYYLSNFVANSNHDLPPPSDYYDGEYDMFTYSTLSESGNFVIADRLQNKIKKISPTNSLIEYTRLTNKAIDYFNITDGNGILYRLGRSMTNNTLVQENNQVIQSGGPAIAPSAWLLTDIVDPIGNYARFAYSEFREYEYTGHQQSFLVHQGGGVPAAFDYFQYCRSYTSLNSSPSNTSFTDVQRISTITTKEAVISFSREENGRLNTIIVKSINGEIIKKITFTYSANGIQNFLKTVKIYGQNGASSQEYKFDYYLEDAPAFLTFIPDYWGYYKKIGSSDYAGFYFPDFGLVTYYNVPSGPTEFGSYGYANHEGLNMSNRNVVPADVGCFSLKKITYPTGGFTEYEYEPNKYIGYRDDTKERDSDKWAGQRIKKIVSNDKVTGETLIKEYKYGANESGYGKTALDIANINFFRKEGLLQIRNPGSQETIAFREMSFSTSPFDEMGSFAYRNPPVAYTNITEYQLKQKNVYDKINGKTEYVFSDESNFTWTGFAQATSYKVCHADGEIYYGSGSPIIQIPDIYHQFYVSRDANWKKPLLQSKSVYKSNDNGYKLTLKEEYKYSGSNITDGQSSLVGLKVRHFAKGGMDYGPTLDYYAPGISSLYKYGIYDIDCGNRLISEKKTTTYDNDLPLVQQTNYAYNKADQLQKTTETKSDGSISVTNLTYPVDYENVTATDDMSTGLRNLKDKHILNTWIEKIVENQGTSTKVLNGVLQTFKKESPLPDQILQTESSAPMTNFAPSNISGGRFTYDPAYQSRIQFSRYDIKGNILEQQKTGDIKEVYLWGYNGQYPVAKITGSDLSTVLATIDTTRLSTPVSDESLRSILSPLRNISNALVSTYTYAPLIGMTSETDPTGKTIFYEYDHFGRLSTIKDENKKVLKQLKYNYYQQQDGEQTNTYYSRSISQSFARNNCPAGSTGSMITYTIPAGKYTSSLNQETADNLALADITTNGQAYANVNGTCSVAGFTNDDQSGIYANNVCGIDLNTEQLLGSPYYISVPAGMFSSEISKEDVNRKARTYAQQMVDNNGSCPGSNFCRLVLNFSDHPNYYPHKFDVSILDNNTGTYIKFPMTDFGKVFNDKLIALIPAGWYSLYIESNMLYVDGNVFPGYDFTFDIFGNVQFGNAAWYDQIHFYEGDTVNLSVY